MYTSHLKNPKMQVWDSVVFAKPAHVCITVVLHVKGFMFLD